MRTHSANDLVYRADILAPDGSTVVTASVPCGVEDLTGRRLEQAQLTASETTHTLVMRAIDAATLRESSYVRCDGLLYIVDYTVDPRKPRPKMWTEIYCHIERSGN